MNAVVDNLDALLDGLRLTVIIALAGFALALVVGTLLVVFRASAVSAARYLSTVITEAVMGAAPVERPVASAAYSFVRFSGGAIAPWAAGKLGENVSVHAPFWMGATAVGVAVVILAVGRHHLERSHAPAGHSQAEGELLAVGDAG